MTTTADVAALVLDHITEHGLPEPASLRLSAAFDRPDARIQVHGQELGEVAAALLAKRIGGALWG